MKSLNQKIKRAMLALGVCGLTFSTGAVANSCPSPGLVSNDFANNNYLDSFGGVTLNKTLTLLNGFENINGATYDPVRGEVVFVGKEFPGGVAPVGEEIDMDDLVVAMKSVFTMKQDPGITFYTPNQSRAYQTGLWDVTYFGATKNTAFGQILYEADYLLKHLSLGIASIDGGQTYEDIKILFPEVVGLGYQSFADRMFTNNLRAVDNAGNALSIEFWFSPSVVTLIKTADASADSAFVFSEMKMQVQAKIRDKTGAVLDPDADLYDPMIFEVAEAFAKNLTDRYDEYSNIPAAAALKKLKRLGKITALVRWLRDNGIPIDMSFMRDYKSKPEDFKSTNSVAPILQVCKDDTSGGVNGGITTVGSGKYTWELLCNLRIQGGITYDYLNDYITPANNADLNTLVLIPNQGVRAAAPQNVEEMMSWNPTGVSVDGNSDLLAVAQTLGRSEKDGNQSFTSVDLGFPNLTGQPLAFTRYYDSFSNVSSGFGPGWSELPFELQFTGVHDYLCPKDWSGYDGCDRVRDADGNLDLSTYFYAHPQINVIDRLSGKVVPFYPTQRINWGADENGPTDDKASYGSARTLDVLSETSFPGIYLYEQHDAQGQVTKQVYFERVPNDIGGSYYAVPVLVATPAANDKLIRLVFSYDVNYRLQTIEGDDRKPINIGYNGDRIDRVWFDSAVGTRETSYGYDVHGRLSSVTKAGRTISYTYQADDASTGVIATNIATIKDELRDEIILDVGTDFENRIKTATPEGDSGLEKTVVYDRLTGTTTTTDKLGRVLVVKRDDKLRLERVERTAEISAGVLDTFSTINWYDPAADALAGPAEVIDARGNKTSYSYDEHGRVTSVTDALNRTRIIDYGYITEGLTQLSIIVDTDAKLRSSVQVFDELGRLKTVHRRVDDLTPVAGSGEVAYTFTPVDKYSKTIQYDPVTGAVDSVTNTANETVSVLDRNTFGQVKMVESAAGYKTEYGYDGLARKTSVQGPADLAPVQLAYYESGVRQDSLSQIITPVGTITKDYDVVNRKTSSTDARGVTTSKFYNQKNQLIGVVEVSPDNDSVLITRYFHDLFGKLDFKILPNGTRVDYEYDGFDRLVKMHERDGVDSVDPTVAPTLTAQPLLQSADANVEFLLTINATTTSSSLSYFLVSAPEGMTIDASTGEISWTPSVSQNSETAYKVVVLLVGGDGGVSNVQFDIEVGKTYTNSDADSVADNIDNCIDKVNEDQRDSDNDGFGNACDADLNNDGIVNFADMAILKSWFGTNDVDADFDGNGTVGVEDLELLKQQFGGAPGPSAVAK